MQPKQVSELYFEAGELLRKEAMQVADTLTTHLKTAVPEDWAGVARDVIGRGELQWPNRLIERLGQYQANRISSEAQIKRVQKYVEDRRPPKDSCVI